MNKPVSEMPEGEMPAVFAHAEVAGASGGAGPEQDQPIEENDDGRVD
jgi:hypothetical protein